MLSQVSLYLKKKPDLNTILLITIITVFVAFAVSYSLLTPALEAPDEGAHYRGIRHMNDENIGPGRVGKLLDREPIYYMLKAGVISFFPKEDHTIGGPVFNSDFPQNPALRIHGQAENFPFEGLPAIIHTLRLFSIIYGIITLIFVYKIGLVVFQNNRWLPLVSTAVVATLPTFIWMNSVINPDSLLWMFSTISIYFLLKFVTTTQYRYIALVAVFAFLAISTKQMGIAIYPMVFVGLGYFLFSKRLNLRGIGKNVFIFLIITLVSITVLFSYNLLTSDSISQQPQEASSEFSDKIAQNIPQLSRFGKVIDNEITLERVTDPHFVHSRFMKFAISGMGWNTIWAFGTPVDIFFLSTIDAPLWNYLSIIPYHIIDILLIFSAVEPETNI